MKILETPSLNSSRIYNQANLSKILPQSQQIFASQSSPSVSREEPPKPQTQGYQGQPGKERKSHAFKSHSPQPEFHSDQPKFIKNATTGFLVNNSIQQSHSSENLQDKEFGSAGNPKTSNFKPVAVNPQPQIKKKASLNLFEDEEKGSTSRKESGKNTNIKSKDDGDNLIVFSPNLNENAAQKDKLAGNLVWMEQDKFKLDEDLAEQLTGEEIAELKKQYVNQKMENKFAEIKEIWDKEEEAKKLRNEAANELELAITNWAKKNNTRNNLITLLATLKELLGKESEWPGTNLSELLNPDQVKRAFVKAIRVVHPDKNQHKEYKQKYVAERVFYELNEAWKDYKNQHGIL